MKYLRICQNKNCQKEFYVDSYRAKSGEDKYCCKKCSNEGRIFRIKTNCDYCNTELQLTKSKYNNSKKHFCSQICFRKYQTEIINLNSLSYEYVKNYIEVESNSECKLLSSEYKNDSEKLHIQCKCGRDFYRSFNHFKSQKQYNCNKCRYKITSNKNRFKYEEIKNILNNLKYELLSETYNKSDELLILKNNEGYKVVGRINDLKNGINPHIVAKSNPYTIENIKLWLKINNKAFELNSKEYNGHVKKLKWKCSNDNCGKIFENDWNHILSGSSCPYCSHIQSKGENKILDYLINNKIKYKSQYTFTDCKCVRVLQFDFYLPDYNLCIEYQGIQHYEPRDFAGKGEEWSNELFKENQIRDQIKKDYCLNNNIKLLEIPYWEFDNIEEILNKICNYR